MVAQAPIGLVNGPVPARPPDPTFFARYVPPPSGFSARRVARQALLRLLDRTPGLCPLQTHVVMCGFPRSGSTLLLLVAEACYPKARAFREERAGINAARQLVRTHPLMISKIPSDLFQIDDLRRFYAPLRTQLRVVLTKRDPRAILTSRYTGSAASAATRGPDGYVMSVPVWREWFAHYQYVAQSGDVIEVEYADLVTNPLSVQRRFAAFIGWQPDIPFDRFMASVPEGFATRALNGLRSFDPLTLDRWKQPQHAGRIREILDELPELPRLLIELGYESDTDWVRAYR